MQRRGASHFFKNFGKIALILESHHQGDVSQADVLVAQKLFAVLNPHPVQIGAESDASFFFENKAEVAG